VALVIFPFFVAGVVDNIGVAGDALFDGAAGTARAAAFSLFFFSLVAGGGTASMGGGGRGHNDDLDLVAGSLCNVRCQQQQDTRSCGGSDLGGGGSPTFGLGKVDLLPLHGNIGLANQVSEVDGALRFFTGQSRPEGAVLLMDRNPLQLNPGRSFVGGHLKVDGQLLDGTIPPRHAPVKDIHDDALNECLGMVYIPINFLCSMVAQDYS
jgi:hypothetical protein